MRKKTTPKPKKYERILDEIRSGSSQVAIIMAGSLMANLLLAAIMHNFTELSDNEIDDIFENNGPLATFSARIRIAYAMGLYGNDLRADLNAIRSI